MYKHLIAILVIKMPYIPLMTLLFQRLNKVQDRTLNLGVSI